MSVGGLRSAVCTKKSICSVKRKCVSFYYASFCAKGSYRAGFRKTHSSAFFLCPCFVNIHPHGHFVQTSKRRHLHTAGVPPVSPDGTPVQIRTASPPPVSSSESGRAVERRRRRLAGFVEAVDADDGGGTIDPEESAESVAAATTRWPSTSIRDTSTSSRPACRPWAEAPVLRLPLLVDMALAPMLARFAPRVLPSLGR